VSGSFTIHPNSKIGHKIASKGVKDRDMDFGTK
jgi:hypothetical protein